VDYQGVFHACDIPADSDNGSTESPANKGMEQKDEKFLGVHSNPPSVILSHPCGFSSLAQKIN
jgi:hypothetical protein